MAPPFLVLRETKRIVLARPFDPREFFGRKRKAPHFFLLNDVLSLARPVDAGTEFDVHIFEVGSREVSLDALATRGINTTEEFVASLDKLMPTIQNIRAALPTPRYFEPTALCAVLGAILDPQLNGSEGDLSTQHDNLFFAESCWVFARCVEWSEPGEELKLWTVNSMPLSHQTSYSRGPYVFAPAL